MKGMVRIQNMNSNKEANRKTGELKQTLVTMKTEKRDGKLSHMLIAIGPIDRKNLR